MNIFESNPVVYLKVQPAIATIIKKYWNVKSETNEGLLMSTEISNELLSYGSAVSLLERKLKALPVDNDGFDECDVQDAIKSLESILLKQENEQVIEGKICILVEHLASLNEKQAKRCFWLLSKYLRDFKRCKQVIKAFL